MDLRSRLEALSVFQGKPPALRGLPFTIVSRTRSRNTSDTLDACERVLPLCI
jgi:hypothetical protein